MRTSREGTVSHELRHYQEKLDEHIEDSIPYDIEFATRYIHKNLFDSALNVDSTLEQCSIRSNTFPPRFKYYHRVSMHHYIQKNRVDAARLLMAFEELDMEYIAHRVGFSRYRTFARAVRRYYKCAPTECRETLRGDGIQSNGKVVGDFVGRNGRGERSGESDGRS